MRVEAEPIQRRWARWRPTFVLLVVGGVLLAILWDVGPWGSDSPCDKFSQVSIDYAGGSDVGAAWDEAILFALRTSGYFEQYPGVSTDEVLRAMPAPATGGATVPLDLDGAPRVSVSQVAGGWRAGGVSFCT